MQPAIKNVFVASLALVRKYLPSCHFADADGIVQCTLNMVRVRPLSSKVLLKQTFRIYPVYMLYDPPYLLLFFSPCIDSTDSGLTLSHIVTCQGLFRENGNRSKN